MFRGVFGVGHMRSDECARMLGATLACGDGAVVSHRTAAALLGLLDRAPVVVDVISPRESGRGIEGIRRHHAPPPRGGEVGHCNGIPCTSPTRTIVDLAGILGERSLRHVVERATVLRILDVSAIEQLLARKRRRGAPALRSILRPWRGASISQSFKRGGVGSAVPEAPIKLRSELEARLLALIRASDLPTPTCNQRVDAGDGNAVIEVDFLWPAQRVVVETDGETFHGNPLAFERDRKRDRELQLSGYRVIRFTYRQIEEESDAVISAIRRLLAATSPAPAPDHSNRDFG
jgi:very-short-patch-repair endonuclease